MVWMQKWRYPLLFLMIGLMAGSLGMFGWYSFKSVRVFNPAKGRMIVIDAGHGVPDPGVLGKDSDVGEADINLCIAMDLKQSLENIGMQVIMTRTDKEGLKEPGEGWNKQTDMRLRAKIAKEAKADLLVSIHLNGFPMSSSRGAQVFYQRGSEEGQNLAHSIQEQLRVGLDPNNMRVEQSGDYYILKAAQAPAIIIECGFMSHPEEEKLLLDEKYQERIAWNLFAGIVRYFALSP